MGRDQQSKRKPALVSFSGIDGAGKSTQIEIFYARLCQAGVRARRFAFWDDVALLTGSRQFTSHKVFRSERGVGLPGRPVNRRDKNVHAWYMTLVRLFLYLLDTISLSFSIARARASKPDVIIFDRYLYDELANLPRDGAVVRSYVRALLSLCPKPDVAYLLDTNPASARVRKPEYPLEFLQSSRASYLALAELAGMTLIPPGTVEDVSARVMQSFVKKSDLAVSPRRAAADL